MLKSSDQYSLRSFEVGPRILRQRIARSFLVAPADPFDVSNTNRLNGKLVKTGKSKTKQSRASSIAMKESRHQVDNRKQELSYYKVLFDALQKDNSQLKKINAKLRNNHIGKSKSRRTEGKEDAKTMSRTQAQHLVSHIQDIQSRFRKDDQKDYQNFYNKFRRGLKQLGTSVPNSVDGSWLQWLKLLASLKGKQLD